MDIDERIGFLLRVAERAEVEGNERAARAFRRMAAEARPLLRVDHPRLAVTG